jgi:cytochrome c
MRRSLLAVVAASVVPLSVASGLAAPLQDAAKAGDLERVRQLIDTGANLDARAGFGTALHWAIVNGHDEVAVLLIERGANVNVSTSALGTPLHSAAKAGNARVALLLLERGANVDARQGSGYTPLHLAAEQGQVEVLRVLIDHGADVRALAVLEGTVANAAIPPLHLAVAGGHEMAAQVLRESGAEPPPIEPIGELMAQASAERGRGLVKTFRCGMCHEIEGDLPAMSGPVGPELAGVVDRPVASVPRYDYTPALRRFGGVWTEDRIYAFISHPLVTVPGTRMDMEARGDPQDRADLIAYLRTLKDTPK